jgi:nicotinate-nucleotide pyrophosphorylase (carboxylating)
MRELIKLAIEEDIGTGDVTSNNIIPETKQAEAIILAKADGIICGLDIAEEIYKELNKEIKFEKKVKDGDNVKAGDYIALIKGNARAILSGERIVLNLLSHLSGVSTQTRKYVDKIKDYKTKILDTRKTLPGFRKLQKYAVKTGGAENHRIGLYDMVMIKDNHIKVAGSITNAVNAIKDKIPKDMDVEVETETLEEVQEALEAGIDWIMLDNMSIENLKKAIELINGKAKTEASGGVNINNIKEVAATGVDYISIGALTHSVKELDLSMNIKI